MTVTFGNDSGLERLLPVNTGMAELMLYASGGISPNMVDISDLLPWVNGICMFRMLSL